MTIAIEDVQTAWNTYVFQNASVQLVTENYFFYDIVQDSERELNRLYFNQEMNFFQALITEGQNFISLNELERVFRVEVVYFREKDTEGVNYIATRNALSLILETVRSGLGYTWNESVDLYTPQSGTFQIAQVDFADEKLWRGSLTFDGLKSESIVS